MTIEELIEALKEEAIHNGYDTVVAIQIDDKTYPLKYVCEEYVENEIKIVKNFSIKKELTYIALKNKI